MKFEKSPTELAELFEKTIVRYECELRKMFGYPCAFYNGNMWTGLFADNWMLRLSESDREAVLAELPNAGRFEPMPGRTMKEYIALSKPLAMPFDSLTAWLDRSYAFVRTLPPKEKKPPRKKK